MTVFGRDSDDKLVDATTPPAWRFTQVTFKSHLSMHQKWKVSRGDTIHLPAAPKAAMLTTLCDTNIYKVIAVTTPQPSAYASMQTEQ